MRSILLLIGVFFFLVSGLSAQENKESKEERIKALKIAFITDELQLTAADSEKFWPLYNDHEHKEREIRAKGRPHKSLDEMSDSEALAFINARLEAEEDLLNLNKQYINDLKEVLSNKQMAKLMILEKEFKRKMLEKIRRSRKGERKHKQK